MTDQANDFTPAIDRLIADIRKLDAEIAERKRMVNTLRSYAGQPPMFTDIAEGTSSANSTQIRSDQFYGKPQATAVREYLEMRKSANLGAAAVREIYEALLKGGYKFDAKNDANAQRGLRISLSKNMAFHRVPNGSYGLSEWYPSAKNATQSGGSVAATTDESIADGEQKSEAADDAEQHDEPSAA